jgi:NAD(P)H-nitrite reductase large subunit
MQSSDSRVYAAGDAASCSWAAAESAHWFQMRLWSQARAMGVYAAHCMAGVQDQTGADMAFELFTHVTRFLGKKVVLLGLYNGQRLEGEPETDLVSYSRVTEGPDRTFVRVLLLRGRVQGAVLIGDTDLEEVFENLILDQLDVSQYGPALLDPDFELDHVFD